MNSLAKEAAAWKLERRTLKGPDNRRRMSLSSEGYIGKVVGGAQ